MTSPVQKLAKLSSRLLHAALNAFGIEVRLLKNVRAANRLRKQQQELEAWRVLKHQRFATVFDIGANSGQFATLARQLWPSAQVHSFEPLPAVFAELRATHGSDPQVSAHNVGLSEQAGTQRMFSSAFSPSSSLLPMAALHQQEWPHSAAHTEVDVRLERLDDWMRAASAKPELPWLVKIDVQGFEMGVINGGVETLQAARFVVLEVSFYELYESQHLFGSIHARLHELGFIFRGNVEQFCSRDGTRVLYADAIFENLRMSNADDRS